MIRSRGNNIVFTENRRVNEPTVELSTVIFLCLIFSVVLWTMAYRGLFADGSHLFLGIVSARGFHHASETRITSTFMTQLPAVLAIRLGLRSTAILAKLYTAALGGIPLICYTLSVWITRRKPVLFCATIVVIVCCFYPLSFLLVGEGNVYLGLFWLAFVILMNTTTRSSVPSDFLILLIAAAALEVYETSAFFSVILALLTARRARSAGSHIAQFVLTAATVLFVFGALCGLHGIIVPRDPGNETGFIDGIRKFAGNSVYVRLLAITLVSVLLAFTRSSALRLVLGIALFAGILIFANRQLQPSGQLALGYVIYQRAQVYCTLFIVVVCVFAATAWLPRRTQPNNFHPGILVFPLIMVFALDTVDTLRWSDFIGRMCRELSDGNAYSRAEFLADPATHRYGVTWTFPTMSVLLDKASSRTMLEQPSYTGWQPFDPRHPPQIRAFKTGETICQ